MEPMANGDVAALWRRQPLIHDTWTIVRGHVRDGHQGGALATAASIGRNAYIKPKKLMLTPRSAANEKLAADLATDLGVNVPPAVLTNPPPGWDGQNLICASLVMHGFQLHWGAAKHGTRNPPINRDSATATARGAIASDTDWGAALRSIAPAQASRAWVFDAWVGQVDHDHPSNIAWGINPDNEADHALAFFDYEMAFGVGGWAPTAKPPFPVEFLAMLDRDVVNRTVALIEGIAEDHLHETVFRIPESHLAEADKVNIFEQLLTRRVTLRAALEL